MVRTLGRRELAAQAEAAAKQTVLDNLDGWQAGDEAEFHLRLPLGLADPGSFRIHSENRQSDYGTRQLCVDPECLHGARKQKPNLERLG